MVSADRLEVVSSPVRQGGHALKVRVKQGDDPIGASGNRNELVYLSYEPTGSEYFYKWSVMFAQDFPSARTWQLFTQWHHEGDSGSPPLELYVYGEELRLEAGSTVVWSAPLRRGIWNDFILHAKWSSDPSVGFLELYHQNELVLPRRNIATQFPGQRNYLKQGLYRNSTVVPDGVLYVDGMIQATKLSDVLPSGPGTPDAGAPSGDGGGTDGPRGPGGFADAGTSPQPEEPQADPSFPPLGTATGGCVGGSASASLALGLLTWRRRRVKSIRRLR
jgi:hypothetical protein